MIQTKKCSYLIVDLNERQKTLYLPWPTHLLLVFFYFFSLSISQTNTRTHFYTQYTIYSYCSAVQHFQTFNIFRNKFYLIRWLFLRTEKWWLNKYICIPCTMWMWCDARRKVNKFYLFKHLRLFFMLFIFFFLSFSFSYLSEWGE